MGSLLISTEELQKTWEKDSVIKFMDYDNESLSTPQLHAKYLRYLREYKTAERSAKRQLEVMKRDKTLLYTGKAEAKDYRNFDLNHKVLKTDAPMFVTADADVQAVENNLDTFRLGIYMCEEILGQIKGRQWQIKNAMEWRRYVDGG